jgi:phosphoribosylglycinamide formyltransferase-1
MQAVIDACQRGDVKAKPRIVISNNPKAMALSRGQQHGLLAHCVNQHVCDDVDQEILRLLKESGVDLLILAGYMKKVGPAVLEHFRGRIINIHPALLPRHGGKGMYGMNVHEAVLAAGDIETGASVHLVDGDYDRGPVISQVVVPVKPTDNAEILAARVLEKEHELLVNTVAGIVSGRIVIDLDSTS